MVGIEDFLIPRAQVDKVALTFLLSVFFSRSLLANLRS